MCRINFDLQDKLKREVPISDVRYHCSKHEILSLSNTLNDYNQGKNINSTCAISYCSAHVQQNSHNLLQLTGIEMTTFLWPHSSRGKWESALWFWMRCASFSDCHSSRSTAKPPIPCRRDTEGMWARLGPCWWDPCCYRLPASMLFHLSVLPLQSRDTDTHLLWKGVWLTAVAKK